jgi:O-antigen/teichoic acid export membrane protein
MSRKRLLFRGVLFGYGALAAQIIYSFASIPLALGHLSKAEFGMWNLITTLASYLMLAEAGMTNAFLRHLFDCKEGKDPGQYGRLFTASILALGGVALLIIPAGLLLAWLAAPLFQIPAELGGKFFWLMLGQAGMSALAMGFRMIGAPLYVHHRQDLSQASSIGLFAIHYSVLYLGFYLGWGIYSMLANQVGGLVWTVGFNWCTCSRLALYPAKGTWGLPDREEWASILKYAREVFMVQVGSALLTGLPLLLVPRLLGLEAATAWAVCTRPFAILRQVVTKPFEVALPLLCEIYVRGDMATVTRRWSEVTQLIVAVSGCLFAVAAANNTSFVSLWTGGKVGWGASENWLVAGFFFFVAVSTATFGIIGLDKSIGKLRFTPVIQAVATTIAAIPMAYWWGMGGLIVAATLAYVGGMVLFGLRYLGQITGHSSWQLAARAVLRPALIVPLAALAAWAATPLSKLAPGYYGLVLSAGVGSALSLGTMLALGVSPEVRQMLLGVLLGPARRFLKASRDGLQTPADPD